MTNMIIRKKNNVLGLLVVTFGVLIFLGNGDAVNIKVSHHKPSVAKHQHKTCKNSEMLHSDIVTNSTFDGQHDNFTFLGRVGSMKECLGLCCTFTKCGLAYLENNTRCFSVQCDDPKLCKIKNDTHGSGHNDIKMSLMIKSSGNQRVYVAAYVVLAMVMLGAALSGTVWIAYIFGQKYREKKVEEEEREKLTKQPQVY